MIQIDTYVGVSPAALRTQINKMEVLLSQFHEECEKSVDKQRRKVVTGLDETWYNKVWPRFRVIRHKECYRKAWEAASNKLKTDPFSEKSSTNDMQQWLTLAENMARQFQRSSSAVERRNGCLSQMYHNGRGLNEKRLKALTVIHNYDIKRVDGTTATMRLFDTEFPDLFSWLLDEMGELPLPRNSSKRVFSNPLKLLDVPS
ncbi:MAG: DUF6399 domain-containing protein [Mariprofundaceae bacterium]|nr:DUF6399 domain-containing protein [Mariprofundaceae bacterium]